MTIGTANSAALLRDGELLGAPSQGLPADLRPLRRGSLHAPRRPDPDARRGGADGTHRPVRVRGLLAPQPADAPGAGRARRCWSTSPPDPSRAPGSAARASQAIAGWHKMQDTYALLGTVAHRLLQPRRQRGGADLLGRLAHRWPPTARRSPKARSGRRRWWSAAWTPMTCACSATACRSSPTSGSSWSAASWTGSSPSARACHAPEEMAE